MMQKTAVKGRSSVWSCLIVVLMELVSPKAMAIDNNVNITGNLLAEPCTLSPNSALIPLDFGNIVGKFFQTVDRTAGMPFTITLDGCDTNIGKNATVKFIGRESLTLKGLIVPDGKPNGLAFGIEIAPNTNTGVGAMPLPFNQASPVFALTNNTTTLNFQGYIQAEPDAIANNSIVQGAFIATATFEINYP